MLGRGDDNDRRSAAGHAAVRPCSRGPRGFLPRPRRSRGGLTLARGGCSQWRVAPQAGVSAHLRQARKLCSPCWPARNTRWSDLGDALEACLGRSAATRLRSPWRSGLCFSLIAIGRTPASSVPPDVHTSPGRVNPAEAVRVAERAQDLFLDTSSVAITGPEQASRYGSAPC